MWSILTAVGVGIVLALVTVVIYSYVNSRVNAAQKALNKIENRMREANCTYLADLLEALIVGDVADAFRKANTLIETPDSNEFFLQNIGLPITRYTILNSVRDYPAIYEEVKKVYESVQRK